MFSRAVALGFALSRMTVAGRIWQRTVGLRDAQDKLTVPLKPLPPFTLMVVAPVWLAATASVTGLETIAAAELAVQPGVPTVQGTSLFPVVMSWNAAGVLAARL